MLLHKFFDEEDFKWLDLFSGIQLSENQKTALIFARETGAVDTLSYIQLTGGKSELAENELDLLNNAGILVRKGKKIEATYYVLNENFGQKNAVSSEKVTEKVTETQKQILEILKSNSHITQSELAEMIGISRVHINKNMAKLQDMNIITRIGVDNGGHWKIVK